MEKQFELLTQQADLNSDNIMEITELLESNSDIVLKGNVGVPKGIQFQHWLLERHNAKVVDLLFISKLTDIEIEKFVQRSLTLENNRLPLDSTFLLALSSHCLSKQIEQGPQISNFCRDFAFHCSRWDTSLIFNGLGFEYLSKKSEKIKSIVYSFSVEIPILETSTLQLYKTINLGKFSSVNTHSRTNMPDFAVLAKNKVLHPVDKNFCTKIAELICRPHAIQPYEDCLNSIVRGKKSNTCITSSSSSQTSCISSIQQSFVVVSN